MKKKQKAFEDYLLKQSKKTNIALGKIAKTIFDNIEHPKETFDTNRKHYPVHSGCFKYFPNALKYISYVSWVGNEQHNPGQELHWDRNKSTDDADARARHILGEEFDVDGVLEEGKAAWRSLAVLEKKLEKMNFKI